MSTITDMPQSHATPELAVSAPQLTPEMIIGDITSTQETVQGPALTPPGTNAGGQAEGVTATVWRTATITGLWTNNSASNAYAYLNAVGWRRLSGANPTAHQALVALARLARDSGASTQCEDDGAVIHSMYVW